MSFDELRQALERLRAEKRTVDLFFRDDDVDEDEATLWQLLNTFLFRGVPINLEVIRIKKLPRRNSKCFFRFKSGKNTEYHVGGFDGKPPFG